MKKVLIVIKKGDKVRVKSGLYGEIVKYSSNTQILVEDKVANGAMEIVSKSDIIEINGVKVEEEIIPISEPELSAEDKIKLLKKLDKSVKGKDRKAFGVYLLQLKECIIFITNPQEIVDKYKVEEDHDGSCTPEAITKAYNESLTSYLKQAQEL